MLKGRGRDPRGMTSPPAPAHLAFRTPTMAHAAMRPATPSMQRAAMRPEPDYEVVEFPSEQYVNAKIQPPPPPPPRPPTGHPLEAGASCGLCGGGGARVRCAECGRRALCASCDDMYHRHPKRRHHQRQALSQSQLRDERPPLPPKTAPPVPPPRKHKIGGDRMSASPKPPMMIDQRRATLSSPHHMPVMMGAHPGHVAAVPSGNHFALPQQHAPQIPLHLQTKLTTTPTPNHLGSMPFLHANPHHAAATAPPVQGQSNTLSHINTAWSRPRGSLQGFGMHPNMNLPPAENWENAEGMNPAVQSWNRPLRRGASVLELSGGSAAACGGCAHCAPMPWRYGSCASLDHAWPNNAPGWPPTCCPPGHPSHNTQMHPHQHMHQPQTPQPYRRAESRAVSRTGSRAGSRAASPAMSVRSRTSRRTKHRTPSPPPVPSSDADSESESESDHAPQPNHTKPQEKIEESLGPAAPPPTTTWQCEHCTYVNEPGVRVCAICCRTPITVPKTIPKDVIENVERLRITSKESPSPARVVQEARLEREVRSASKPKKERTSTGCGPSPPRETNNIKKPFNRLVTPTREQNTYDENLHERNDMAVGPSPPKEVRNGKQAKRDMSTEISPPRDSNKTMRVSPFRDSKEIPTPVKRHSISVGPSPPRENSPRNNVTANVQKKSTGTSPPRDVNNQRSSSSATSRTNVSNTGTSPPPQSISTQTYEVPNSTAWERASSVSRSRPRRRFREDIRRERSQSRHSMSSDTRESDRSVRTAGTSSRWEWRERDSSPGGEWGDNYNSRLARRASHLDLRRARPNHRSSYYGSEAPSPERQSTTRAISLEALAGAGARREAERGMELAQLMGEAERLGFSAAEVQAALTQSPAAPLAWLRERWPSLCAGVRAAAARLAPTAAITELEARAALARHRGAMWPAVTECVDRHRRQTDVISVGEEGRLRGHVWGSPAGADDDAAPPRSSSRQSHRLRAEDSSDEFEAPTPPKFQDDDWMYLPLNVNINDYEQEANLIENNFSDKKAVTENKDDVAKKLKILLQEAGIPLVDEKLLLQGLLSGNGVYEPPVTNKNEIEKTQPIDFIQSENDFIDAYNALTRSSPLPNINKSNDNADSANVNKPQVINTTTMEQKVLKDSGNTHINVLNNGITENHKQQTPQQIVSVINNEALEINHQQNEEINVRQQLEIASKENHENLALTIESPTKDLVIPSEIQEIIPQQNNPVQTEDKSNNLSTIVDSTQRLIQQMKEEINSDIHSIDGRTISQSESETSSDGSDDEQESSFSESEEGTDNLTSDEKEITSSEDEDPEPINNEVTTEQYKSSSEENDAFEEALDHVENQLEDFKHVNIEMLDSIARTLQEERTFSVTVVDSNAQNIPKPPRKQDLNNNLFVAVNTFEEIYDDLTSQNNKYNNVNHEPVPSKTKNTQEIETNNVKLLAKESIIISQIKTIVPTKLIISENKHPKFKAQIEYIEEPQSDDSKNEKIEIPDEINSLQKTEPNQPDQTINTLPSETNTVVESNSLQIIENITINEVNDTTDLATNVLNSNINNKIPENPNVQIQQESKIPGNVSTETTIDTSSIKNSIMNKSNIPKLIKVIPNNKPKHEKNAPKLIVSKVPVRRASIKQHPAPAPPKTHFGNITSGHVKQLQTRLFNNKVTPSKPAPTPPEEPEVKPSTSTLSKKKQAPLPPTKHPQEKQVSPPKVTPTKEKKQFFRETCRTEDEWTESDSEDSQVQIIRPTEESIHRPPSPPPPITMRRVSGQIIDLAKVRLPEGSPERQARMLLAEGATETWEQAQLAVELISQGADPPAALLAALECADLTSALAYLYQDCELCASRLPEHEMVSMLRCTHRCCRECAHLYFTVQITERSIADCVCPYCKLPELESLPEDAWLEYFAHLDILLKTLLEIEVHELFQRKLRDRTLARDPNFRWCMECSSGFFVHPKQKRIRCPECRSISCASCRKPWTANHEGLSCEQYTAWLDDNDPERSVTAIQQHLRDNGLECPRCHFKYSLSRGGCMHFTCTQCKYEFCYGCGKPFTMGARCGLSDYCAKLGLHAHHPRNCLFYLRDKEPHELQTLLQMNNVTFESNAAEGSTGRCPVQLQRETPTGLVDGTCGSEAPTNYAGLCKTHYVEYLAGLARGLDPIPIMDVTELVAELRRRALPLPERGPWDSDPIYAGMCAEIVKEKIPLD